MMRARHVVPPEVHWPTAVFGGKTGVDGSSRGGDIAGFDEHLESGSPPVVGRSHGIEAEELGPEAEQRRVVRPGAYERFDHLAVEAGVELESGDELRAHPSTNPARRVTCRARG